jgi:hypothetical protein
MSAIKIFALMSMIMLISSQTNTTATTTTTTAATTTSPLPAAGNYTDNAPTQCTLTSNAQLRLSASTCFSELQNIIACLPPQEQDVWAQANAQNTNTTVCFDCSYVSSSLKNVQKNYANSLSQKIEAKAKDKRSATACFKSFAKSTLGATEQSTIDSSLNTIVSNQKKSGQTTAALIMNVQNVFINRRRMLCLPNAQRSAMVNSKDASGNILDFKYNSDEANTIVTNFLSFFEAKTADLAAMANEVSSMTDIIANSATCAATTASRLRLLQTATATTTTTTPATTSGSAPAPTTTATTTATTSGTAPASGSSPAPMGTNSTASGNAPASGSSPAPMGTNSTASGNAPASGKGPSGANPNKGKSLGADLTTYVNTVITSANTLKTTGALDLASRLSASFISSTTTLNCQPGGFEKFFSRIASTTNSFQTIKKALNPSNTKCDATGDYVYFLQNNNVSCEGTCSGFTTVALSFTDATQIPSTYYFAAGCAGGAKFIYGTWSDLAKPTTIYTSFKYLNQNIRFNSEQRCLSKAAGCVPGGAQTGGNAADGQCATASMNDKCKTGINDKCKNSGLANVTVTPTNSLPTACDYVTQGVEKTDATFVQTCFTWIAKTFFRRSMTFSPEQISNDNTIASAASATTTLRYLQDSSVSIVPVASDVSLTSSTANVFATSTLSTSDVVVDGSTPTSTGSVDAGLAEVNTAANNSGAYMKMSALIMLVLALLI